jgi:hypothetical protein
VPVTLAAYALDTLEDVKADLGVTGNGDDDQITRLINRWSQPIIRETGREFAPALPGGDPEGTLTRQVEYVIGSQMIWLRPYEAREVTAITINHGATNELVLSVGDWQLEPITNPDGVWDRIVLAVGKEYWGTSGLFSRVPAAVTGRWGWPAVPEHIKGLLRKLIKDDFQKGVAIYADADGGLSGGSPVTVPFEVREELQQWKRPYIGAA